MLKSSVICIRAHRRSLSYFSNAFNNLVNQGPPPSVPSATQKFAENTNLNLDIFINQDHKQMDLLDKLVKLRKQKYCTTVPLLPNVLVKQLMDYSGPQEVINVLRSPLQYGIFIDAFTGCYLMDFLLHNGNAREAAEVSALLVERELCNNELIAALSLKSFYAFLKDYKPSLKEKVEESPEVEKVRVKFLRNYSENVNVKTEEQTWGEVLIKLGSSESLEKQLGKNASLLGFVLCGRIAEAENCITQSENMLYKDVLLLCKKLIDTLEEQQMSELKNLIDKTLESCTQSNSIDEILDSRVKSLAPSIEPKLISEYTESYKKWETQFKLAVEEQAKIEDVKSRVKTIESTLNELTTTRQNLWFFENKEDIDMQIFKKKVSYPKRWFGKKKKPKAVDAFYVPPNISRGN